MPPRKKRRASEEAPAPVQVERLYDPALDTPDGGHQPPLDGMPGLLPTKPPRVNKRGVSWVRYRVLKPVHCDECVRKVHAAWGTGGTRAPNLACYRRKDGAGETFWCWEHMEAQRAVDGLAPIKTTGK
jgi:hypothetical protein